MNGRRVSLGRRGEDLAVRELMDRGYDIIDRNWRCQIGEVDVVTRRGESWTFFEVRTRRGRSFGTPEESVTPGKVMRMVDVAKTYLSSGGLNVHRVDWRLGVVAVEMDEAGYLLRIEVYDSLQ